MQYNKTFLLATFLAMLCLGAIPARAQDYWSAYLPGYTTEPTTASAIIAARAAGLSRPGLPVVTTTPMSISNSVIGVGLLLLILFCCCAAVFASCCVGVYWSKQSGCVTGCTPTCPHNRRHHERPNPRC